MKKIRNYLQIIGLILLLIGSFEIAKSQTPTPTATPQTDPTPEIKDPEIKDFDRNFKILQKSLNEVREFINSDDVSKREIGKNKAQEMIDISKYLYEKLEDNDYAKKMGSTIENPKSVLQLFMKQVEIISYDRLAKFYAKDEEWLRSIKYYKLSIKTTRETIADAELKSGKFYVQTSLDLMFGEANNLQHIANILVNMFQKYEEAISYIDEAIFLSRKMQEEQKDHKDFYIFYKYREADFIDSKARYYKELNNRHKSIELSKQALEIVKSLPNQKIKQMIILDFIGSNYYHLLDFENALKSFTKALKIAKEINNYYQITIQSNLTLIYNDINNTKKAEDIIRQNLKFLSSDEYFEILRNQKHQIPFPSEWLKQANNTTLSLSDEHIKLYQYVQITSAYFGLKDYDRAIEYGNKTLQIVKNFDDKRPKYSLILLNARAYQEKKDWQNSIKYYLQAIDISSKSAKESDYAIDLTFQSKNYLKTSQLQKAEEAASKALLILKSIGKQNLRVEYSNALNMLSLIHNAKGNRRLAIFYGKQGVNSIQMERQQLKKLDVQSQRGYLKKSEKHYRRLAGWLIAEGRVAEAEEVLKMLKEEELSQFLRRDDKVARELLKKTTLSEPEREALQKFDKIADKITSIGRRIGKLEAAKKKYDSPKQFPQNAELKKLNKKLTAARTTFNEFQKELKTKYFNNRIKPENNPVPLISATQTLLQDLNQPKTVIISTIIEEKRLNLIVSTTNVSRAHTVDIAEEKLNKLVADFRQALKNSNIDPRPLGKKLYDILFPESLQKDLAGIEANTIVWSLDGTLRYVPTAALWDGDKYLVERYNQSVITLASRLNLKDKPTERKNLTALGVGVSKEANITGLDNENKNFPALKAVPEELCSIVKDDNKTEFCNKYKRQGVISGKNLLDEQFTYDNFEFFLGRYPIVHIASHFDLNPGNEGTSYLLLGGKNNQQRKLTLKDLRDKIGSTKMKGTEILTLSACNTGMSEGKNSSGEEIESFGAIAQSLGAKSVISSLWAVSDPSTKDLMTEFYKQLQNNPKIGKAEAMRKAQITLMQGNYKTNETPLWRGVETFRNKQKEQPKFNTDKKAPFAHPYYWSPFVLIGNWK